MLDNAISRSSDGFYRVTKDMNRYWGTVDEVERESKKLRRGRCWESSATNWIFAIFACCRSSATMYVGAPEDVSETDYYDEGGAEVLYIWLRTKNRTDDQSQARYLKWKLVLLTLPQQNVSSSRHRTPHPFLHVNPEYHLTSTLSTISSGWGPTGVDTIGHNWRMHQLLCEKRKIQQCVGHNHFWVFWYKGRSLRQAQVRYVFSNLMRSKIQLKKRLDQSIWPRQGPFGARYITPAHLLRMPQLDTKPFGRMASNLDTFTALERPRLGPTCNQFYGTNRNPWSWRHNPMQQHVRRHFGLTWPVKTDGFNWMVENSGWKYHYQGQARSNKLLLANSRQAGRHTGMSKRSGSSHCCFVLLQGRWESFRNPGLSRA